MMITATALSADQQVYWATLAQVNAAIVIALVVEVGAAAWRPVPNVGNKGLTLAVGGRVLVSLLYAAAAVGATSGTITGLGALGTGVQPPASSGNYAAIATVLALAVVVFVPAFSYLIWTFRLIDRMFWGLVRDIKVLRRAARVRKTNPPTQV